MAPAQWDPDLANPSLSRSPSSPPTCPLCRSPNGGLDRKIADFRSDVRQAQNEATTKAVKRVQREKPYEFKRKAHEEQARFNAQIEESVREAQHALATVDDSPSLQRAQEALEKGTRLLAGRQKLIKIANRSANGWGVVAEYTADEVEDEKRLEKAEKAAERVNPKARPSTRLPRYAPYGCYAYTLGRKAYSYTLLLV